MTDGWPRIGGRARSRHRGSRPAAPAHVERLESRGLPALGVAQGVAAEGGLFPGRVATFASGDVPAVTAADYHATINWGDGTPVTTATITPNAANNTFDVLGLHTYAAAGPYPLAVTLAGSSGNPVTSTGLATVSASTLAVTAQPLAA